MIRQPDPTGSIESWSTVSHTVAKQGGRGFTLAPASSHSAQGRPVGLWDALRSLLGFNARRPARPDPGLPATRAMAEPGRP